LIIIKYQVLCCKVEEFDVILNIINVVIMCFYIKHFNQAVQQLRLFCLLFLILETVYPAYYILMLSDTFRFVKFSSSFIFFYCLFLILFHFSLL